MSFYLYSSVLNSSAGIAAVGQQGVELPLLEGNWQMYDILYRDWSLLRHSKELSRGKMLMIRLCSLESVRVRDVALNDAHVVILVDRLFINDIPPKMIEYARSIIRYLSYASISIHRYDPILPHVLLEIDGIALVLNIGWNMKTMMSAVKYDWVELRKLIKRRRKRLSEGGIFDEGQFNHVRFDHMFNDSRDLKGISINDGITVVKVSDHYYEDINFELIVEYGFRRVEIPIRSHYLDRSRFITVDQKLAKQVSSRNSNYVDPSIYDHPVMLGQCHFSLLLKSIRNIVGKDVMDIIYKWYLKLHKRWCIEFRSMVHSNMNGKIMMLIPDGDVGGDFNPYIVRDELHLHVMTHTKYTECITLKHKTKMLYEKVKTNSPSGFGPIGKRLQTLPRFGELDRY